MQGVNLYRVRIAPGTWKISGPPQRLTTGAGFEGWASVSGDGRMVFANLTFHPSVWAIPLDANRGITAGERRNLSGDHLSKTGPAAARDGRTVAFESSGEARNRLEVRLRDLASGKETAYPVTPAPNPASQGGVFAPRPARWHDSENLLFPRLNHDGALLAWVEDYPGKQVSYLAKTGSAVAAGVRVCTGCRVLGFFAKGDLLALYDDRKLVRQKQDSGAQPDLVALPSSSWVAEGALSPDDAWLALQVERENETTAIQLVPARAQPIPESDWITLASGPDYLACPRWSPDGGLVYYFSDRDGYACIWAQRVDTVTKKPIGASFAVLHEHLSRYRVEQPRSVARFDVAKGLLLYYRGELTGNIRMTGVELDRPRLFGFR